MAIERLERLDETTLRLGGNGDNWHTSWAQDDTQFTALCDGRGWPNLECHTGKDYNTRVYRVAGVPPDVRFQFLPAYPDLLVEPPDRVNRFYGFGILALDGQIFHYLSTPNRRFAQGAARFVGAKLIWSPDNGSMWLNQDNSPLRWESWEERSRANMVFFNEPDEAFALLTVLQMGRNYADNRDGFVYLYTPNGNGEGSMNQLAMARVPKGQILNRSAYEFFAQPLADGSAIWTRDIADRGVVHTFPSGWVNATVHPYAWHPSVVYVAPLGLYLMANWGMGCASDGMWFGKPSYLGFWTAPQPWGPWQQVHEETAWTPAGDPHARAYQPQIVPKWISADGKSFWLVWTDFQERNGQRPYYAFNVQQVRILTSQRGSRGRSQHI